MNKEGCPRRIRNHFQFGYGYGTCKFIVCIVYHIMHLIEIG